MRELLRDSCAGLIWSSGASLCCMEFGVLAVGCTTAALAEAVPSGDLSAALEICNIGNIRPGCEAMPRDPASPASFEGAVNPALCVGIRHRLGYCVPCQAELVCKTTCRSEKGDNGGELNPFVS